MSDLSMYMYQTGISTYYDTGHDLTNASITNVGYYLYYVRSACAGSGNILTLTSCLVQPYATAGDDIYVNIMSSGGSGLKDVGIPSAWFAVYKVTEA